MRWFWFDRYTEFVSGKRAVGIKNVTLAEEHLHDHFPGCPVMPNALIIEGLAQTGGLLVSESQNYARRVVLAKLSKAKFHCSAFPGDTLTYRVEIVNHGKDGSLVTATSHIGDRLQCEADIFFGYLSGKLAMKSLFEPGDLIKWLRIVGVYDVGVTADGQPLEAPGPLLEYEKTLGIVV